MIRKTEAIVLHTQKHGDSSLICTLFTRQYGRRSFMIKGYRSARAKSRHSYFQPMSLIEVVFYHKEGRDLQLITESSNRHFFHRLQTDPLRITLGMVIMEVFYQSVREEERNDALFGFLATVLVSLDEWDDKLIHVFLWYLVQLTRYLGFFPSVEVEDLSQPVYFDLREGSITHAPGARGSDHHIAAFSLLELAQCRELRFSNADKKEMIATLLQYYLLHVEGFKEPESLKVLEQVF